MTQTYPISAVELQAFIDGVHYPANKEDLMLTAEQQGADEDVVRMIEHMPDQEYVNQIQVIRTIIETRA